MTTDILQMRTICGRKKGSGKSPSYFRIGSSYLFMIRSGASGILEEGEKGIVLLPPTNVFTRHRSNDE